jgi:hypothetical protein
LLEEATMTRFELTDVALEGIQMKIEEMRTRHENNRRLFDDIIERRMKNLLR